jgi:hypothetical protein
LRKCGRVQLQDITVAILGQLSLKMVRTKLMNECGGVHLDERHEPELSVLGLAPLVTLHQPEERPFNEVDELVYGRGMALST